MTRPDDFDLARLIEPMKEQIFFSEYWELRPLTMSDRPADMYRALFSVRDFDRVLHYGRPEFPALRVVQNQVDLPPDRYTKPEGGLNLNQLYKSHDEGHTLILSGLQDFWPALAELCQVLQARLDHRVVANAYLAPRSSTSLLPHYDTHDVFVLQIEGEKRWWVYPPSAPTPLLGSFQPVFAKENLGTPLFDVLLQAGDLMYLPRGFIHHAEAGESASLHVTLGVYPAQWVDLVNSALVALAARHEPLRKALPVGYLTNEAIHPELEGGLDRLTSLLADEARLDEALSVLTDQMIRQSPPLPDGHFADIARLDEITLESQVIRRRGMRGRVLDRGTSCAIQFPGNTVSGPPFFRTAFERIAAEDQPFTPASLPDELSEDRKLTLVRRLVRGGLLTLVSDADS